MTCRERGLNARNPEKQTDSHFPKLIQLLLSTSSAGCQHGIVKFRVLRSRRSSVCPPPSISTQLHRRKGGWQFHGFLAECSQVFSCSINHQTWPWPRQCRGKTTEWAWSRCNRPGGSAHINKGQASAAWLRWKCAVGDYIVTFAHLKESAPFHFKSEASTILGLV